MIKGRIKIILPISLILILILIMLIYKIVTVKIELTYFINENNDTQSITLTNKDKYDVLKLLTKIKPSDYECDSTTEFVLTVNNEYKITFGDNGFGNKVYINASTGTLVSIPKELYIKVTSIKKDYIGSTFELNSNLKYEITTDLRWMTMLNDGGSHHNEYYQIDLENNTVTKHIDVYQANLNSKPRMSSSIIYTKGITKSDNEKITSLLESIRNKEDLNDTNNYSPYTIKSYSYEKDIYNTDTINELKVLLIELDKR